MPVKQSSSEMPPHVNANVTSDSNSNVHNLKSRPVYNLSKIRKDRRTRNMSRTYDVSTAQKVRIMEYTACLLVSLWFTLIFSRSKIFHSIPFSIRLFIAFAVFTSMVIITGVLIVYFTAPKLASICSVFIFQIQLKLIEFSLFSKVKTVYL